MESDQISVCKWQKCQKKAEKHVHFGLRVHDAVTNGALNEASYSIHHVDLCSIHVYLVGENYVDVKVFELGVCPRLKNIKGITQSETA
ncbi:MAG: hypothetical protein ABIV48_05650 [Pyrinomonadaceae bacterium]